MGVDFQLMVLHAECDWCGRRAEYEVPLGYKQLIPPKWDSTLKFATRITRMREDVASEVICPECDTKAMMLVEQLRCALQAKRSSPPSAGEGNKEIKTE